VSVSVTKDAKGAGAPAPFGRVVNVTKTFDTAGQPVPAVKDVSFQFRKGDLIALLGPVGLRENDRAQDDGRPYSRKRRAARA
jgi:ABC-type polysaccharide/polyol phosphate transport system ATPase subunit